MVPLRSPAQPTDDLWRLTMEHSPVGMAIVSPSGDFLTANVALCDMLGYEPDELSRLTFQELTHPDDLAADLRLVQRTLAGELGSYRLTKRYFRSDGSVMVGDLSVALLRDEAGEPIHFISQIADITDRHAFAERLEHAEEVAEQAQRRADAIFESVSVGLLQVDADGHYQSSNQSLRDMLARAFPEGSVGVAGQVGFAYDATQSRPLRSAEMPTVRASSGEEYDDLLVWIGEDPRERRAVSVSARSLRDRYGAFQGAVLACHDVTDRIQATTVKEDFVATVSHELRTPLTSALAYLELLDDSAGVGDDARVQVRAARRNMMRLSHLVADLLYANRASSGSSLVDPYPVDLVTVVREAVDAAAVDMAGTGVGVGCTHPASLVAVVDGMRLRQALDNLLANAIAYSDDGGQVLVTLEEVDGVVHLSVSDDGVGIDPTDVDEVFGRFYRGDNARRRQVPGTGLGLDIVRTVVEAHGGTVDIVSAPGEGTTVRVVLPH